MFRFGRDNLTHHEPAALEMVWSDGTVDRFAISPDQACGRVSGLRYLGDWSADTPARWLVKYRLVCPERAVECELQLEADPGLTVGRSGSDSVHEQRPSA